MRGLEGIYRSGFNYIKAGVMLMELQDGTIEQGELTLEDEPHDRGEMMGTLDRLNDRYGRGIVRLDSAGTQSHEGVWTMRQDLLTPQYTTCWEDMPVARA